MVKSENKMALNETLNATINATAPVVSTGTVSGFFAILGERIVDLLFAPFLHPQMFYIILPMIITLVVLELYEGRYTKEELGWNSAVGHALVLIFVSVDLLKTIYPGVAPSTMLSDIWFNITHFSAETGGAVSTLIAAAIGIYGLLLLFLDFLHWLPKRFAFFISGNLQIHLLAYVGIAIVYSHNAGADPVPVDWYTLLAAIVLFVVLRFCFGIIHLLEPKYKGSKKEREKLAKEAPPPVTESTLFKKE